MAWIAAIIAAAAGGLTAAQQKKAAKKGTAGAGVNLEAAYKAAKGEYAPYSEVGKGALSKLAELQGIAGYRTPGDRALMEHLANRPVAPTNTYGFTPSKRGAAEELLHKNWDIRNASKVAASLGLEKSPLTPGGMASKRKKKDARRYAAETAVAQEKFKGEEAKYAQDLAAYEAKTAALTAQRDEELKTYDPTAALKKTPGYQFRYQTGLGAVGSQQAARSSMLGGGALKELTKYGQDFATGEYGAEVNRLSNLAGIGERSAGALSNISIGQGTGQAGLSLSNAAANSAYYGDLNNVVQSSLGNYLAYRERQPNSRTQSSYDTNSPTSNPNYRPGQTLDPENYN